VTPTQLYILQAVGGFCLPVDSSHIKIPMCHLQTFCLFSPLVILLGLTLAYVASFSNKSGRYFLQKRMSKSFSQPYSTLPLLEWNKKQCASWERTEH